MLPIQSLDASVAHPRSRRPPVPLIASSSDPAEARQQKPKTLPCKYCSKHFRRVEHVQRHERTHTKEKPFQCQWDRCGKTFGRRDLLVRHEKLVHLNENSRDNARPRKLSTGQIPSGPPPGPTPLGHQSSLSDSHMELDSVHHHRPPLSQHQHQQQPPPPAPPPLQPLHSHSHPHSHPHAPQHAHHQSLPTHFPTAGAHISPPLTNSLPQPSHDNSGPPPPPPQTASRPGAGNLDLLSDAALAREVNGGHAIQSSSSMVGGDASTRPKPSYPDVVHRDEQHHPQHHDHNGGEPYQTVFHDDYNLFMDDLGPTPHLLPPHFDTDQPATAAGSRRPSYSAAAFPSLGPDIDQQDARVNGTGGAGPKSWLRMSIADHNTIKNRLDDFSAVLPRDFVFPSRHTLTRFLEGYASGFHEHVPFLHLPTFSPADAAPELLLAVLAVGAQYRFESNRGYALWYASRAVAAEQVRRRRSGDMSALLPTLAAYSPHSTRPSPSATYRHSFASAQSERPTVQEAHREPYSANTSQARLETIQAVLLLFAIGLWGAEAIVHESMSLQGTLAALIREEGLTTTTNTEPPTAATTESWEAWIRVEGAARTKLAAYCFFNLCSTAYNLPPLMLTSELNLRLPLRSRLWRAETAWQWHELRQATPAASMTVHEAFSQLFASARAGQGLGAQQQQQQGLNNTPQLSSLANYILIHALLQHIYLLKQTSLAAGSPYDVHRTLRPEDVEDVSEALRVWQTNFENRHQQGGGPEGGSNGASSPLAYNASALLRLAYIRLYTDVVPPSRALETRDAALVASALVATPPLMRSLRLHRAVFQVVHALSMLVRAGVSYVARTKSTEWSVQHSLCNFECAVLLAKWLLTLAAIGPSDPPVSPEEKSLLGTVRRMLDETEFAVPIDPCLAGSGSSRSNSGSSASGVGGQSLDMVAGSAISSAGSTGTTAAASSMSDSARLRQLAAAVVRLWAETFKGSHVFDVVKVMGASLDGYADLIERRGERTP